MAEPKFAVGEKVRIVGGKNHNRVVTITERRRWSNLEAASFTHLLTLGAIDEWWYWVDSTVGGTNRPFPQHRLRPYDPPKEEIGSWDELKGIWQPSEPEEVKTPEPVTTEDVAICVE